MRAKKPNGGPVCSKHSGSRAGSYRIWKEFLDDMVPQFRMSLVDRAVYSHLVRHSRLEGKTRLHFSIVWLGRNTLMSGTAARNSVRRLVEIGALRLVERSKAGHVVDVRLPAEIFARRSRRKKKTPSLREENLEKLDFMEKGELRRAIHERENGRCFYCLRRMKARLRCIDHVVPRVRAGKNSYRNLVSSCGDCNAQKGEMAAGDFLRVLYREGKLTAAELTERMRAVEKLAAGKLRPAMVSQSRDKRKTFTAAGREAA